MQLTNHSGTNSSIPFGIGTWDLMATTPDTSGTSGGQRVSTTSIDHPVRGGELEPDDPRMRALEAYIMAQRSGTPMNYGKH